MQKIALILVLAGLILGWVTTLSTLGQTPAINTQRIGNLEELARSNKQTNEQQRQMIENLYAAHSDLKVDIAGIKAALNNDEKLGIGVFLALVSIMIGTFLQQRSTHTLVNGRTAEEHLELTDAKLEIKALRTELLSARCPLVKQAAGDEG